MVHLGLDGFSSSKPASPQTSQATQSCQTLGGRYDSNQGFNFVSTDHDRDSSFSGEPCCSCLLEMFIAKTLLGLLIAKDVLLFLIGDALMALLVALGLLELLFATDLTALPTSAFTLSS